MVFHIVKNRFFHVGHDIKEVLFISFLSSLIAYKINKRNEILDINKYIKYLIVFQGDI
jgi:hypothetical protein